VNAQRPEAELLRLIEHFWENRRHRADIPIPARPRALAIAATSPTHR